MAEWAVVILTAAVFFLVLVVRSQQAATRRLIRENGDLHVTLCRLAPEQLTALKEKWAEEELR